MLPAPASSGDDPHLAAAPGPQALIDAYVAYLAATGRQVDARYRHAAERFLARWPDPMSWAAAFRWRCVVARADARARC
jgi:hypothetical protein